MADGSSSQQALEFIIRFKNEADKEIKALKQQLGPLAEDTKKVSEETERANRAQQDFQKQLGKTASAAAAFLGAVAVVRNLTTAFADYQTGIIGVQKTTNLTNDEMKLFSANIRQIALDAPVTTKELTDIGVVAGQLGIRGVAQLTKFSKVMSQMSVATNLTGEEGALALAKMLGVAGESVDDIDKLASAIVSLGNNSRTAGERDIAYFSTQMGTAIARFGGGTKDAAALGTAIASLGIRAETGATAVGRAIGAIEQAGFGSRQELQALADITGLTEQQFQKLAKETPLQAFDAFLAGLKKSIETGKNYIPVVEAMGINNAETLKTLTPLAKGLDDLHRYQALANKEFEKPTALIKEAEKAYGSYANQLKLTGNYINDLKIRTGETLANGIAPLLGGVRELLGGLIQLDTQTNGLITGLGAVAVTFGLVYTAITTVASGFVLLQKAAAVGWITLGGPITAIVAGIIAIGAGLVVLYQKFKPFTDFVDGIGKGLAKILGITDDLFAKKPEDGLKTAIEDIKTATEAHRKALDELNTARATEIGLITEKLAKSQSEIDAEAKAAMNITAQLGDELEKRKQMLADFRKDSAAADAESNPQKRRQAFQDINTKYGGEGQSRENQFDVEIADLTKRYRGAALIWNEARTEANEARKATEAATEAAKIRAAAEAAVAAADGNSLANSQVKDAAKARLRDAEAALLVTGKENRELDRQKAINDVIADLRGKNLIGLDVEQSAAQKIVEKNKGLLAIVDAIVNKQAEGRDILDDVKNINLFEGAQKDYERLAASLERMRSVGKITANQQAGALQNSTLEKNFRDFTGDLEVDPRKKAEDEAKVERTQRLADLDTLIKAKKIKDEDYEKWKMAIELRYQKDTHDAKVAQDQALRELDASIGFGVLNDPDKAGSLDQDLAKVNEDERIKLENLETWRLSNLDKLQQYEDRKAEIEATARTNRNEAETAALHTGIQAIEDGTGAWLDVLKTGLGEQNSIYKAAFIANKAAAIANSIVSIQEGVAKAMKLEYPANLVAAAGVAAQGASIIANIQSAQIALKAATGGYITGPGGPKDDKVPAMLSNGEFVVNAAATRKYIDLLSTINSGKNPQKFAAGGRVSMPSVPRGNNMGTPVRRGDINLGGVSLAYTAAPGTSREQQQHDAEQMANMAASKVDERLALALRQGGAIDTAITIRRGR